MRKAKAASTRRIFLLLVAVCAAAVAWTSWNTAAADEDQNKHIGYLPMIPFYNEIMSYAPGWKFNVLLGGVFVDEEGTSGVTGISAGRAAEYGGVENSPLFGFRITRDAGKSYAAVKNIFINKNDFLTECSSSMFDRVLLAKTRFNKFPHRLDNDLAADWAGQRRFVLTTDSEGLDPVIDVTQFSREDRIKLPNLPGTTIYADFNTLWRSGERQARTLDHCTSCHVSATGQTLRQRIWDLRLGAEFARKPYAVRYLHAYRYFDDDSEALSHDYINRFGNFRLEGVHPFAVVPNNSHVSDMGAARVDLGTSASAIVKARRSSTSNKSNGYSVDSNRFSGILTYSPVDWLRLKGRYDRLQWDNEVPDSASRTNDRFAGTATLRPWRELRFEGSYEWERVDRTGDTDVAQTTTKLFRLTGTYRPDNSVRLMATWRHADVDNPFGHVLEDAFSRIDGVLLSPFGTDEDEFEAMLTYAPFTKASTNLSYRWSRSENGSVNLEAKRQQLTAAGHVVMEGGIVLHGRVFWYNNDVDRDVYLGVLAPLLEIVDVPYTGKGTSLQFGVSFPLAERLLVRPSYGYTRAESSFDDANLGSGVATPSRIDATINRFTLEGDITLTQMLDLLAVYILDDYSDISQPLNDGTVHWFYGGLVFKF
jgi:hypothetical protein